MYICKFTDTATVGFSSAVQHIAEIVKRAVEAKKKKQDGLFHAYNLVSHTLTHLVILNSLRVPDIETCHETFQRNHKDTFSWIFQDPNLGFSNWLRQDSGIFWISGIAGSGKTVLMKYIINDLRGSRMLGNCSIVDFFFCRLKSTAQRSMVCLLRTMLLQILEDFRDLIPIAFPKQWGSLERKTPSLESDWTETALWKALLAVTNQNVITGSICLLIDGIDEYYGSCQAVVDLIHTLMTHKSSGMSTKICFSSRPLSVFENGFKGVSTIRLHEHNSRDIAKYVNDRIMSYPITGSLLVSGCTSQTILTELVDAIVKRASGVFLWAKLVMDNIVQRTTNDGILRELLYHASAVPADLQDSFQHLL
ncbi:hypothetical protein K432DRAFT_309312, partial [Lepidopterella palustris CBS 459.81]